MLVQSSKMYMLEEAFDIGCASNGQINDHVKRFLLIAHFYSIKLSRTECAMFIVTNVVALQYRCVLCVHQSPGILSKWNL